jgi:nitrogen permease regulator 3-like protein
MPPAALPPNPCLVAILLVIQSRSGPRLVFHYPADPLSAKTSRTLEAGDDSTSTGELSSSDTETIAASTGGDDTVLRKDSKKGAKSPLAASTRSHLTDDDDEAPGAEDVTRQGKEWQPSSETLLGLEDLVTILTPSDRLWHKRKFEVGINDLCFLGWPVFIREDGTWQKRKIKSKKLKDKHEPKHADSGQEPASETTTESEDSATDSKKPDKSSTTSSGLTMFNVVFVMNPPVLEYNLRTKEMYDNVVKKFGKALKWEQARQGYIWTESELITSIKTKHISKRSPTTAMYKELLSRSSLAKAISSVYTSISTSRIASVTLSPTVSTSLQIPPITSISTLPSLTDPPAQPALWLTTVNNAPTSTTDLDTSPGSSSHLARHFTLLLTDSKAAILKDIANTTSPIAGPLSTFVNACNPTKSFHKISLASNIQLGDLQTLARHLIYWRRGIAIPPLHQRDTYVVSPNANMRNLNSACKAYEAQFPTLPGLAKMLSALSGTPRPWATLFPSPDHKDAYMQILAWLMRGGWVTQLRTFAFVRVDPDIKRAVKEKEPEENDQVVQKDAETEKQEGSGEQPSAQPKRPSIVRRPSMISRPSSSGDAHQQSPTLLDDSVASLIMNPHRASPLESKYLELIGETLLTSNYSCLDVSEDDKAELKKYWPTFIKYFNGADALEKIPVREGLKRKVVSDMLARMGLSTADAATGTVEVEEHGKILVGVRHW